MDKYQAELDEFTERFENFKNARMILYGIGRYTATLLGGLKGFRFVGLMDKDPANVGKIMFGLPIVDKAAAEEMADMVIINTSETYWDVIFSRIQDIRIPVFYKNGVRAVKKEAVRLRNPFKELSYEELCRQIREANIVSFDFFDTLFMRAVCSPRDVFRLMETGCKEKRSGEISYTEIRNKAKEALRGNYSLDELYAQIEALSGLPHYLTEDIKNRELSLEKKLLVPREGMLECLKEAMASGKEVYIISDMYLPEEFYREVLAQYGIALPAGHILLSNVLDAGKADGSMWRYYTENVLSGRLGQGKTAENGKKTGDVGELIREKLSGVLHIGDHQKADIEEPLKYGIRAYRTPSAWDLLTVSSMGELAARICGDYDFAVMGCILKELFRNPYILGSAGGGKEASDTVLNAEGEAADGTVRIQNNEEMGYCVFGPVILTFLLWLMRKSKEDGIKKLVFMSRDGYFLKEDFEYLCELYGERRKCCYLGISRQLAMTAAVTSEQELMEYASMPYSGNVTELFEDRFGIENVREVPGWKLENYLDAFRSEIEKNLLNIRENYLRYLEQMELDDGCAVVDLGYYGNNQKYLNKLMGSAMAGYYFNVNLSEQNPNTKSQKMTACFQKKEDLPGENSQVLKRMIYLESFLTAPYGMVKGVDGDGNFVYAPKKKNQEHFQEKLEINQGVKRFLADYVKLFGEFDIRPNPEFADWYYGYCIGGAVKFADCVKGSFYNDNGMMNRIESMLFY